jgi:NitT/TauT family transport system substrate-binding protein
MTHLIAPARRMAALLALALLAGSCLAACGSSSVSSGSGSASSASAAGASSSSSTTGGDPAGGGSKSNLSIGYFTGLVAEPETVIGSVPSLQAQTGSKIKWVPITAGATALAEMRAGAFDLVAGVGNPPTVAAIANGTPIDVIWAQSFDADSLLVPSSITSANQLKGKTIGDLEGSSEDYELRGWLTVQHLTGKVNVLGFASEQAAAAAYIAGKISGAYVEGALEEQLTSKGAHALTNAKQIANLGYPSLDVLVATESDIKNAPATVQKYVCAEVAATKDLFGPSNKTYFSDSAKLLGVPASQAVSATSAYLPYYIPIDQELHWLSGGSGSPILASYEKTATFDKQQGRIPSVPSASTLGAHINDTFAKNALAGQCS